MGMTTLAGLLGLLLVACGPADPGPADAHGPGGHDEVTGPHGGRLLTSGDLELELLIFERGVAPEMRAWVRHGGEPVDPTEVSLRAELARLGGRVDEITFEPQGDHLRGDKPVDEPHAFRVSVEAAHGGRTHRWSYESLEGRTRIAPEVARALGIETAIAGPGVIADSITVYGRVRTDPQRVRELRARFEGVVRDVRASVGTAVSKGDPLILIESNESFETYTIRAPIGGVITQRDANPGEPTSGRLLLTITDPSSVWVGLAVFPQQRSGVRPGSPVSILPASGGEPATGVVASVDVVAQEDQSVIARVELANPGGRLVPGTFVSAEITVAEHEVPLAVRRDALQTFRDFTVVYEQVGDEYEVRMLDLGREGAHRVEVLDGIEPGARYVSANSYVIKADIEKSGAAHGH